MTDRIDQLKQLIEDVTAGEGWLPGLRSDLVPEEHRGEVAKRYWNNDKFIYGMEYGLIAALNLLSEVRNAEIIER